MAECLQAPVAWAAEWTTKKRKGITRNPLNSFFLFFSAPEITQYYFTIALFILIVIFLYYTTVFLLICAGDTSKVGSV